MPESASNKDGSGLHSPLLVVKDLDISFHSDFGDNRVLDKVSFSLAQGETLGIVGESGCGKSVTALSIMGLLPKNATVLGGEIQFDGTNLLECSDSELDHIRGNELSMIFQDALASLNPVFTVENQLIEAIQSHQPVSKKDAKEIAIDMLKKVGLPDPKGSLRKYPFELSGGMRQRVMIAMALVCHPKLLISDEATTALDVTIQSQIMRMMEELRVHMNMSMILITHDIGLIAEMTDRALVMYAGQVIEEADVFDLFHHPLHPYTKALIEATPDITDSLEETLEQIPGNVPENYGEMTGCRFFDRCPFQQDRCKNPQSLQEITNGHKVRCHLAKQEANHG